MLGPVLDGALDPEWIGPAVFTYPAAEAGPPRLALYPVCTTDGDDRC